MTQKYIDLFANYLAGIAMLLTIAFLIGLTPTPAAQAQAPGDEKIYLPLVLKDGSAPTSPDASEPTPAPPDTEQAPDGITIDDLPPAPYASRKPLPPQPITTDRLSAASSTAPEWELPSAYYRPGLSNLVALNPDPAKAPNDPINVIVYGPNLDWEAVQEALHSVETAAGEQKWRDNNERWPPAVNVKACTNPLIWTPLDQPLGLPFVHKGASTNVTRCPALIDFGGDRERNHNRYWDFLESQNDSHTVYIAGSNEDNFVDPLLRCGLAHCLTDYNRSREEIVTDIQAGADILGWTVREMQGELDDPALDQAPVHANIQDGPYGAFTNDAVDLLCLDQSNGDYCDNQPAGRPIALSQLLPLYGSLLPIGETIDFSVKLGYSDAIRDIQSVTFRFDYETTDGAMASVSASADSPGTPRGEGTWSTDIELPDDAKLSGAAYKQDIFMEIEVCDSEDVCWTLKDVKYILTSVTYDFVFLIDTTGSMGSAVDQIKSSAASIALDLTTSLPGSQFGVAEFRDYPQHPYGDSGDYPFLFIGDLTDDLGTFTDNIASLSDVDGGNNGEEAQLPALDQAVSAFSYRENFRRFILVVTDNNANDSDTDPNYPGPGYSSVVSKLQANRIKVIGVSAGGGATFLNNIATDTGAFDSGCQAAVISVSDLTSPGLGDKLKDIIVGTYQGC